MIFVIWVQILMHKMQFNNINTDSFLFHSYWIDREITKPILHSLTPRLNNDNERKWL